MRRESKRQSQLGGKPGTKITRSQNPDRNFEPFTRDGAHGLPGRGAAKIRLQLKHVLREGVDAAVEITAQGAGGGLVAAGCAAQSQVNPSRVERFQRAELF